MSHADDKAKFIEASWNVVDWNEFAKKLEQVLKQHSIHHSFATE